MVALKVVMSVVWKVGSKAPMTVVKLDKLKVELLADLLVRFSVDKKDAVKAAKWVEWMAEG